MTDFKTEAQDRAEKIARVAAEESKETDAQAARIEQSAATSRGVNEAYFAAEEARAKQAAENKPKSLPKLTNEEAIAVEAARYPRLAVNPQPVGDPLMDRETDASKKAAGYATPKLKPSLTLQPAPEAYPPSDPRRGLSVETMKQMGLNPDPKKKFNEK